MEHTQMDAQPGSETVEALLEAGLGALDSGNLQLALAKFNAVLAADPDNPRAARLVKQLEQTILDGRRASATPASGEFVVVVEESEEDVRPELRPNVISRGTLDRLNRLLEEATAVNEAISGELASARREGIEARQQLNARDRQLVEVQERLVEVEQRSLTLDEERRDLERLKRVRERQTAELELRLAERRAFEKKALEEIRVVSQARDQFKSSLEAAERALGEAAAAHAALSAQLDDAAAARAANEAALAEKSSALDAALAALHEAEAGLAAAAEDAERGDEERDALRAALAAALAEATALAEARDALTAETAQLRDALAAADAATAAIAGELATALEARDGAAQQLEAVRAASEQAVAEAKATVTEAQTARSAMRTEIATMVIDLEAMRTACEKHAGRIAELEAAAGATSAAADEAADARVADALAALETARAAQSAAEESAAAVAAALMGLQERADAAEALRASEAQAAAEALAEARFELDALREALALVTAQDGAAEQAAQAQHAAAEAAHAEIEVLRDALVTAQARAEAAERAATAAADEGAKAQASEQARVDAAEAEVLALQAEVDALRLIADDSATLVAAQATHAQEVGELVRQIDALRASLAERDHGLVELGQQLATALSQPPPAAPDGALLAEVEHLRAALQAANERARRAEASGPPQTTTTTTSGPSPRDSESPRAVRPLARDERPNFATPAGVDVIEMALDDASMGPRVGATPIENASVTGAFRLAEEAERMHDVRPTTGPPPIPAIARTKGPAFETTDFDELQGLVPHAFDERLDTPVENSALQRLNDPSLSAAERLAWVIDEAPFVDRTDGVPSLSAQAAFVLQNIDGVVSFADLIDIVGLPADETTTILVDLLSRGVIASPSLRD